MSQDSRQAVTNTGGPGAIRKIATGQLRMGMYVHKLVGSWLTTPFWQSSFLVDCQQKIDKIRASAVTELWIDTGKGCDVRAASPEPCGAPAVAAAPFAVLAPAPAFRFAPATPAPIAEELQRAVALIDKSKVAVLSMFQDARMGRAIDLEGALPLVDEIAGSVIRNSSALIGLARLKTADNYTYMHSVAVCALMIALARQLGLDDAVTRELGLAGLLHDVGKMVLPMAILNKPGKLTIEDFDIVKGHPAAGQAMLLGAGGIGAVALDVCLHHHEKFDGSG